MQQKSAWPHSCWLSGWMPKSFLFSSCWLHEGPRFGQGPRWLEKPQQNSKRTPQPAGLILDAATLWNLIIWIEGLLQYVSMDPASFNDHPMPSHFLCLHHTCDAKSHEVHQRLKPLSSGPGYHLSNTDWSPLKQKGCRLTGLRWQLPFGSWKTDSPHEGVIC